VRDYERMRDKVMDEVKRIFKPEFLNRIDGTVVFHALAREHILEIVDLMMKEVQARVLEHGWVLQSTDAAREWLAEHGYDPKFGARPLRRLIQDEVEDKLSEEHLKGGFSAGDVVEVDVEDDKIVIGTPKPASVATSQA